MELSAKYNPKDIEDKWYAHWEEKKYFHSEPDDREKFSIVIPPPNVTGILHMGHMLNNTIQDVLTRKARLEGKNACWVPGTDHASIATEAKVVRWLREQGIKKSDITREEFLNYAWKWTDKYGGIILEQLKKLGASCDWQRTAFTMDATRYPMVIKAFVDLHKKGKLYRDYRMVNWDVEAKTVLSNEEVIHGEENAQLYYINYKLVGAKQKGIVIATQRPETIFADVAVAVNPNDDRFKKLIGRKVLIPLINRAIPIIADTYVDIDFGTGALKITPAHDVNDYEIGKKFNLPIIDILNDDGTLNHECNFAPLIGKERFAARKEMKKLLTEAGTLIKIQDYKTNIGRSERTNSVVEPKLSLQWYVDMQQLAAPALEAVETDAIAFYPRNYKNIYRHWMSNIRDWCISRQLWWGHRVPAWYFGEEIFVAETPEDALAQAKQKFGKHLTIQDLHQDEDVLDTWFSSWLWPMSVFEPKVDTCLPADIIRNPKSDIDYYYPTDVLVTGPDIIFLWVARMAMAGFEWKHERPFKEVYFTGLVRDKMRRKMSKSLGNSPDALKLIEDFGADGVRFGMLSCSPAGGDLLFDEKLCEQGRNFCNKLWNALRLIKGWETADIPQPEMNALAYRWLDEKSSVVLEKLEEDFKQFRLSEVLMDLYKFIWDDYCSWYLEMIKPAYGAPIDKKTLQDTEQIMQRFMVMLHPFMPFITEELWNKLGGVEATGKDCCVASFPKSKNPIANNQQTTAYVQQVEQLKDIITQIRDVRNQKGIKMKEALAIKVADTENARQLLSIAGGKELVMKLANLSNLDFAEEEVKNSTAFISGTDKFFVILTEVIDAVAERENILKELTYQRGFLKSVEIKLSNDRFVSNAPAQVLDNERKKRDDAQSRIAILEESLASLN